MAVRVRPGRLTTQRMSVERDETRAEHAPSPSPATSTGWTVHHGDAGNSDHASLTCQDDRGEGPQPESRDRVRPDQNVALCYPPSLSGLAVDPFTDEIGVASSPGAEPTDDDGRAREVTSVSKEPANKPFAAHQPTRTGRRERPLLPRFARRPMGERAGLPSGSLAWMANGRPVGRPFE